MLGDIDFAIDGKTLAFHETVTYRGLAPPPQSGNTPEWRHTHDYRREKDDDPAVDPEDEVVRHV